MQSSIRIGMNTESVRMESVGEWIRTNWLASCVMFFATVATLIMFSAWLLAVIGMKKKTGGKTPSQEDGEVTKNRVLCARCDGSGRYVVLGSVDITCDVCEGKGFNFVRK